MTNGAGGGGNQGGGGGPTPDPNAARIEAERRRSEDYERMSLERQKARLELREQDAQLITNAAEKERELADIALEKLKNERESLELKKQQGIALTAQEQAQLGVLSANIKTAEQTRKQKDLQLDIASSLTSQVQSLTGITGRTNTFLGQMTQLVFSGGSLTTVFSSVLDNLKQTITVGNVLGAIVDRLVMNTINLAKEQDKAYADFEKEVGNVRKYEDSIMNLVKTNGLYGISVTDAAKQFSQFKQQFAGFESLSQQQQTTLAKTAGQLEKLGIATNDVIKTQDILVKGMGMTVQQSTDLQKSLYATANAMGIPPKKMAADFANAAPQLAAHGKSMTKVFLDLQNNAKNTGIAFDRLLNITQKFDTFEGAASSAGQLNAILGGDYLNSIELLNATEGERVKILQESLKASGRSIDSMSKQEQMATAQALGLSDVSELQKLMNNETTKGTVETIRAQKAQEQMNKAIEDARELGDMWNTLLGRLSVSIRPIIEALKHVVAGISAFIDGIGTAVDTTKSFIGETKQTAASIGFLGSIFGFFGEIIDKIKSGFDALSDTAGGKAVGGIMKFVVSLALIYGAFKLVTAGIRFVMNGVGNMMAGFLNTVTGPLGTAIRTIGGSIADVIKRIAQAADKGKLAMLAFGAAMLMAGLGIAAAAMGMAQFVNAFSSLNGEQLNAVITALSIGLLGFIAVLVLLGIAMMAGPGTAAVLGMLALGAALMMIGIGIGIASVGLAKLIGSLSGIIPVLPFIGLLIYSLGALGVSLLFLSPVFAIFSLALAGLGTVALLAFLPLMALGVAFLFIGKSIDLAGNGIKKMVDSVTSLFDALNKANPENMEKVFDALFDSLSVTGVAKFAAFSEAADGLADSLIAINKNLADMITKINIANGLNFAPKVNATSATQSGTQVGNTVSPTTTAAAMPAAGSSATNAQASTNIVPVAIYIDSKKIGELLDPRYKKMIEESLNNIGAKTVPV